MKNGTIDRGGHLCGKNCGPTILLAIALAPQSFLNGCADDCVASILAILNAITQAQLKYCRSGMIVFQSNVIKVKKKAFTRYIGVTRIFDSRVGSNCKSHAMTSQNFLKRGTFVGQRYRKTENPEVEA